LIGYCDGVEPICIGESNEHVSSREDVQVIVAIALDLRRVPNRILFTNRNHCFNENIGVCLGVVIGGPECLPATGIAPSIEVLLGSIVDDGDSLGHQNECEGIEVLGTLAFVSVEE